ncbi:serum amyloid A-2 protein-like [Ornithodoros turicata]|uniref:serum amyloid A-2 protein-like n=1 Tax=Ornithodoros turicata TaxID=34597 RepID=UPI00313870E3
MRFLLSFFLVALTTWTAQAQFQGPVWASMLRCLGTNSVSLLSGDRLCATREMFRGYQTMRRARCRNCERYFHCQANYNAVKNCNKSQAAKDAAKEISDCRENVSGESWKYEEATRHGRDQHDCGDKFLRAVDCTYNPSSRRCGWRWPPVEYAAYGNDTDLGTEETTTVV